MVSSSSRHSGEPVVILGGGLGGLTFANALDRLGLPFELYEQAPELTEVGAGIGLTRGVMDLFDALGLGDELRAIAAPIRRLVLTDKNLRVRRSTPPRFGAQVVHRAELVEVLRARLPTERIHLSKRVTAVRSHPDHAEIDFEDGETIRSGCVVAADGIGSVTRRHLFPDISVRYIDQTIWRGIAPRPDHPLLDGTYLEIWDERRRFITVPYGTDRIFWLAVEPAPPGGQDNPETVRDDLDALFGGFHPVLRGLMQAPGTILRNDMADLGTASRPWHHHHVGFLGDAIHATTPNLGQGGCQAMEDAVCLALALHQSPDEVEAAFACYQRLREKKVMGIVRDSWRLGRAAHTRNPLVHHAARLVLERTPDALIHRQERTLSDLGYLRGVDPGGFVTPTVG